jgi:hypothetical protein
VTASENGEIGRIDGRIGIGAPTPGVTPFVQVARLLAAGRAFVVGVISDAFAFACPALVWSADGAGDSVRNLLCNCGTAGALSRVMMDFLNHDGRLASGGDSFESRFDFDSNAACFLPSRRVVEDFGRNGSMASEKYSWLIA